MDRERELKRKQLPNIPASKKLRPNDIHRIVQHTDNSIFDEEKCKKMVYHELETFNIAFISLNQASSIVENSGGRSQGNSIGLL